MRTLLFLLCLAWTSVCAAQDDPASSRAAAFEAVEGAQAEQVPGGALLVGAYGVAWLLVLAYVLSVGLRQSRLARDLDRLRTDVAARQPPPEES